MGIKPLRVPGGDPRPFHSPLHTPVHIQMGDIPSPPRFLIPYPNSLQSTDLPTVDWPRSPRTAGGSWGWWRFDGPAGFPGSGKTCPQNSPDGTRGQFPHSFSSGWRRRQGPNHTPPWPPSTGQSGSVPASCQNSSPFSRPGRSPGTAAGPPWPAPPPGKLVS